MEVQRYLFGFFMMVSFQFVTINLTMFCQFNKRHLYIVKNDIQSTYNFINGSNNL